MDVSVIIVNWNTATLLAECLAAVTRELATVTGECIVVDNASAPADLEILRRQCPDGALVTNPRNIGFAGGVNRGVRRSRGRYLMLLNPDAFLGEGCLRHLVGYLDASPQVGIVGPQILDPNGTVQGSARMFPGPLTAFFGRTGFFTRHFPSNPASLREIPALAPQVVQPISVDWVSGACLLIRRRALEEVGDLDEQFFMYWEDADLCWRMRQRGWQIMCDPRVRVVHCVGASSRQTPFRSTFEFHRSAYRLYRKHVTGRAWHPLNAAAAAGLLLRACGIMVTLSVSRPWKRQGRAAGGREFATVEPAGSGAFQRQPSSDTPRRPSDTPRFRAGG